MRSIRAKVTTLTVCAVAVALTVAILLGFLVIRSMAETNAERTLRLLCETGQKNLNAYYDSVAQSVEIVSSFVDGDLKSLEEEELRAQVDRTRDIFAKTAKRTNGVLTYYYRIDPAVSADVKGFWYTNLDGEGFEEHEVTDITLYDTEDTSALVWFTVPKSTGLAAALYYGQPGCAGAFLQCSGLLPGSFCLRRRHGDRLFDHGEAGGQHPAIHQRLCFYQ